MATGTTSRYDRRRDPCRGRVGHRGNDPRMARQGRRLRSRLDETIVEISTDKVDVELPAPASGTVTEILVEEGDTVTVGQVIARIAVGDGAPTRGDGATRRPATPATAPAGSRALDSGARHRDAPASDRRRREGLARRGRAAAAEGVDLASVAGQRPGRADRQGRRARAPPHGSDAAGSNGAAGRRRRRAAAPAPSR